MVHGTCTRYTVIKDGQRDHSPWVKSEAPSAHSVVRAALVKLKTVSFECFSFWVVLCCRSHLLKQIRFNGEFIAVETERNMTADACGFFADSEDLPHGPRLGGSGDMLSTFLHVNGAHTRHQNQLQDDENKLCSTPCLVPLYCKHWGCVYVSSLVWKALVGFSFNSPLVGINSSISQLVVPFRM